MQPARHLEILRNETGLVGAIDPSMLDAVIPTLEDWNVERVVRHLGKIHSWVLGLLELEPGQSIGDAPPFAPMPKGPDCLPAYRDAADAVLTKLDADDPERLCVNFSGIGTVGWWMRRQAQEVSVHRVDAQDAMHAAGGDATDQIAVDGAADGIDEWARFFLAGRWVQRIGSLPEDLAGHTVHIHGTDDPAPDDGAEWLLTLGIDDIEVESTHAKGDVALRGPANDLLLALWGRRPLASLDVIGDRSLAERLVDAARF